MKRSKFSDTQILAILKQAESGIPVPQLCREHGISTATFYNWCDVPGGAFGHRHRSDVDSA